MFRPLWTTLLVSALACGCMTVPNMVNYAAADAMDYSGVRAKAKKQDPSLAAAIKQISESPEHKRVQGLLADLPADMDGCLVIEMADASGTEQVTPAVLSVFVSGQSAGFFSNFAFDEEGAQPPAGGEWRAAVWAAPDNAGSLLPDDPSEVLPTAAPDTTQPANAAVVIITLANHQRVLTIAVWDQGDTFSNQDRMIRYLPKRLQQLRASHIQATGPSSWRSVVACLD